MSTPVAALDRHLTVAEVAAALRVDERTVYRHIHAGRLEAVRFGGSIRIPALALDAFLVPAAPTG